MQSVPAMSADEPIDPDEGWGDGDGDGDGDGPKITKTVSDDGSGWDEPTNPSPLKKQKSGGWSDDESAPAAAAAGAAAAGTKAGAATGSAMADSKLSRADSGEGWGASTATVVDSGVPLWLGVKKRLVAKEAELRRQSTKQSLFDSEEYQRTNKSSNQQIFTSAEVTGILINTLLRHMKAPKPGLALSAVDDNPFVWRVRMDRSAFPPECALHEDLVALDSLYERSAVELTLRFDMNLYPFYPPELRVVWPRLANGLAGRVLGLHELMLANWKPIGHDLDAIFAAVRLLLTTHGKVDNRDGINDPHKRLQLYTDSEFALMKLSVLTQTPPLVTEATIPVVHPNARKLQAATAAAAADAKAKSATSASAGDGKAKGAKVVLKAGESECFMCGKAVATKQLERHVDDHLTGKLDANGNAKGAAAAAGTAGDSKAALTRQRSWGTGGSGSGGGGDSGKVEELVAYLAAQKKRSEEIQSVLCVAMGELSQSYVDPLFADMCGNSCLLPFLGAHVRNDNLNDIERRMDLYHGVFGLVRALAAHPTLVRLFEVPLAPAAPANGSSSGPTLLSLVNGMRARAMAFHSAESKKQDYSSDQTVTLMLFVAESVTDALREHNNKRAAEAERKALADALAASAAAAPKPTATAAAAPASASGNALLHTLVGGSASASAATSSAGTSAPPSAAVAGAAAPAAASEANKSPAAAVTATPSAAAPAPAAAAAAADVAAVEDDAALARKLADELEAKREADDARRQSQVLRDAAEAKRLAAATAEGQRQSKKATEDDDASYAMALALQMGGGKLASGGSGLRFADPQIDAVVRAHGLKVSYIADDGNCAFSAFAHQLAQHTSERASMMVLRHRFADAVGSNWNLFRDFFPLSSEADIKRFRTPGHWDAELGDACVLVLAILYRVHVRVYDANGMHLHVLNEHMVADEPKAADDASASASASPERVTLHVVHSGPHWNSTTIDDPALFVKAMTEDVKPTPKPTPKPALDRPKSTAAAAAAAAAATAAPPAVDRKPSAAAAAAPASASASAAAAAADAKPAAAASAAAAAPAAGAAPNRVVVDLTAEPAKTEADPSKGASAAAATGAAATAAVAAPKPGDIQCPVCGRNGSEADILVHAYTCDGSDASRTKPFPSAAKPVAAAAPASTAAAAAASGASDAKRSGATAAAVKPKKLALKADESECVMCFKAVKSVKLERHLDECGGSDGAECPLCGLLIAKDKADRHVTRCMDGDSKASFTGTGSGAGAGAAVAAAASAMGTAFNDWMASGSGTDGLGRGGGGTVTAKGPSEPVRRAPTCAVCAQQFGATELYAHQLVCWKCPLCQLSFPRAALRVHCSECVAKGGRSDEDMRIHYQRLEQGVLTPTQLSAIQWVQRESKKQCDALYDAVCSKFRSVGLTEQDLQRVLRYIKFEAPMVIHVQLDDTMQFLANDTHYRNQFETNTSKGGLGHAMVAGWEDRMFGKHYPHNTAGFDRVKYGVMNITNDPCGVQCCWGYGDSYLLLQNVRLRSTFASGDSAGDNAQMATCEYYAHVLHTYTEQEIRDIHAVASGAVQFLPSTNTAAFKEVQVHGPVKLCRDVRAIVVHPRHRKQPKMLELLHAFCTKNGCQLMWHSGGSNPNGAAGGGAAPMMFGGAGGGYDPNDSDGYHAPGNYSDY